MDALLATRRRARRPRTGHSGGRVLVPVASGAPRRRPGGRDGRRGAPGAVDGARGGRAGRTARAGRAGTDEGGRGVTPSSRATLPLAVLTAMLLSAVAALVQAPYVTGDEAPHVDYAYQVWQGELPVFEDGLEHRPEGAWVAPVQWTAQHPPLYYLLVAPVVGPLAEAGHPVAAVYAARAANVLLSGVLVLVAHGAARRFCRPGSTVPLVVAFIVAAMAAKSLVGGSGYNDLLAAVFVTAMFGVAATAIRRGLDAGLVLALSLLAGGAALTRLSAGVVAVVVAGVAGLAGIVRARQGRGRWSPVAGLLLGGPALVLATAGWFYARNVELTGTVTGSHFDWSIEHQGRSPKPLWQVLVEYVTWLRLPNLFWWAGQQPPRTTYVLYTMIVTGLVLVWIPIGIAMARAVRHRTDGDRQLLVLLVLPVVVLVTMQVVFASNSGGVYPRYLLPVALPLCLAIAAGLGVRPRLLIPVWTAVTLADLGGWVARELTTPPAESWYYTEAPVPSVLVAVLAGAAVIGTARLVLATTANRTQVPTATAPATQVSAPTAAS
ncbi:DUF2142 domain-containing protein [Jiangella aurantiaca]|uniref:DUF2142 domain-containing protein n=1 Tax=Jiangella aurantiaca TaxID=2530373 RepID=A0A4R5AF87_9ACTN|nr:DUF2142 domain-containing protein [Jiangella aurantiaca]